MWCNCIHHPFSSAQSYCHFIPMRKRKRERVAFLVLNWEKRFLFSLRCRRRRRWDDVEINFPLPSTSATIAASIEKKKTSKEMKTRKTRATRNFLLYFSFCTVYLFYADWTFCPNVTERSHDDYLLLAATALFNVCLCVYLGSEMFCRCYVSLLVSTSSTFKTDSAFVLCTRNVINLSE